MIYTSDLPKGIVYPREMTAIQEVGGSGQYKIKSMTDIKTSSARARFDKKKADAAKAARASVVLKKEEQQFPKPFGGRVVRKKRPARPALGAINE